MAGSARAAGGDDLRRVRDLGSVTMYREEQFALFTGIVMGGGIMAAAFALFDGEQADILSAQAIERGYALHCPQDGRFAWIGECDDE